MSLTLSRLQSVMNAAARLIFSSLRSTTSLRSFASSTGRRLQSGLLSSIKHAFTGLHRRTSSKVDELCQVADVEARRRLRSASSSSLIIGCTRLSTVGDRAFPVVAARIWNILPQHLPQSLLHLRCLSSGHASRLIFLLFLIPGPDHVQCSCSDTCHFGHFNRS